MQSYGFLGCDVSKGICDFYLSDNEGNQLEPVFQLDDNQEGHDHLIVLLKEWLETHNLKKIVIGVESTGGYENNWFRTLRSQKNKLGVEVFRINPKRIYFESKTEGRRSIDDGVSASVIAGYLRKNYTIISSKTEIKEGGKIIDDGLKKLHKYIETQLRQSTRVKNQLEKILYSYMPEILSVKPEKYSAWFLTLLMRYPCKKSILRAGIEGLSRINHLSKSKAEQIIVALKKSVGRDSDKAIKLTIKEMAKEILQLQKKVNSLKEELLEMSKPYLEREVEIVNSVKGIGAHTAVGFVIELGDINRFEKGSNLVAFWGINPTFKRSGDKTWKQKMSKDGSPTARSIMYQAATGVVLHEPYFKAYYAKQRKKGLAHYQSIGVVMSKLTRVLYGMVKSNKEFDGGIDQLNQEKINQVTNVDQSDAKLRRFQQKELNAPISRRQRSKRKKEQEQLSQVDSSTST